MTKDIIHKSGAIERIVTNSDRKARKILKGLEAPNKQEALIKQANLSREFLVALFKALPTDVQAKIKKDNPELMTQIVELNTFIDKVLAGEA